MKRRIVIPHFSRAEAELVLRLIDTYLDAQNENGARGEARRAWRARKQLLVGIRLATPPRRA